MIGVRLLHEDVARPPKPAKPTTFRRLLPVLVMGLVLIALLAVLVARLVSATSKVQSAAPRGTTHSLVGQLAPNITLAPFDASQPPVHLSTFIGHPVVLNFWATWCQPCQQEAPLLASTARAYSARGVTFLGVTEQSDPTAAAAFLKKYGITYFCGTDNNVAAATAYGVPALPMTFFLDRTGHIQKLIPGSLTKSTLDAELNKLLAS